MINSTALNNRSRFTAVYHPVRMFCVVLVIKPLAVVIACKLEDISAFLTVLPLHIVRAECDIAVAIRVMKFHKPFEPSRYLLTSLVSVSVKNLISHTPAYDRRAVSVTAHP